MVIQIGLSKIRHVTRFRGSTQARAPRLAYLPEDLEVFLFDAQQLAVLASDDRRMPRTVVQYRLAERSAHAERTQSYRVLQQPYQQQITLPVQVWQRVTQNDLQTTWPTQLLTSHPRRCHFYFLAMKIVFKIMATRLTQ